MPLPDPLAEPALEPDLPIVDPHHHLWDWTPGLDALRPPQFGWQEVMIRAARYLVDDLAADLAGGHDIRATVFLECGSGYRADGPEALRPVGETAFVARAARAYADAYGPGVRACAGIVGHADLMLGDAVAPALEAHLAAGEGRFRGVRYSAAYDPDASVLGPLNASGPELYGSDAFRAGFAHLAPLGLSFDAWVLEPQLPDLVDLARRFPDTAIVVDHMGTPLGVGPYQGRRDERFGQWRRSLQRLAELPNVTLKLGGLGMDLTALPSFLASPPASSEQLAAEWRPYVEAGVEVFGAGRCMFESNYPSEYGAGSYGTVWNAFKRIAAGASAEEKAQLFSGTATRVYRL